jgi:hypothetical protein
MFHNSSINVGSTVDIPTQQEDSQQSIPNQKRYKNISEIRFGIAVYPLKNNINILPAISLEEDTLYSFSTTIFPEICGKGITIDEAKKDWEYEFHRKFQEIYTKLNWERTKQENEMWKLFEENVDIQKYRKQTPLSFQQTGKIIKNKNIPNYKREIEWLDEKRDVVDCADCPLELLQYEAGQYFRADVLREYQTDKLIKICSVSSTKYRDYTDKEITEFIDSLPTTKNLSVSKSENE